MCRDRDSRPGCSTGLFEVGSLEQLPPRQDPIDRRCAYLFLGPAGPVDLHFVYLLRRGGPKCTRGSELDA